MSLYHVRHYHEAETCPARDPEMGAMLLSHINPQNALKFGVDIQSHAVLDGEHTFILIVDADEKTAIEQFMQPFSQAGPVEIAAASHCETVVERMGC